MDISSNTRRVIEHSPTHANRDIHETTLRSIDYYRNHRDEIPSRLRELEKEWDIERVLEANASGLAMLGLGLGLVNRRFLLLPVAVSAFLLQHALQGWCPPLSVLRRRGWRTQGEIDTERVALRDIQRSLH